MRKMKMVPFALSIALVTPAAALKGQAPKTETAKTDSAYQQKVAGKGTPDETEDGTADPNQTLVKHKAHPSSTSYLKTESKPPPPKPENEVKRTTPPRVPTPPLPLRA